MAFIAMLVPENRHHIKCPFAMTPQGIVVHNTANDASARAEISYMIGNNNHTSYHYAIDDVDVVQGVLETRNAWHAGATYANRNMIGIEICYSRSGGTRFTNAEIQAAQVIATLCKHYGWGIDKVQTHQQQNGKNCPHRTLSDRGWQNFLNLVQSYMGTPTIPATPIPKSGWHKEDDKWRWYEKGTFVKDWKYIGKDWYWFDANGYMYEEKWLKWDNSWFYLKPNGQMAMNQWYWVNGECFCFNNTGRMYESCFVPYENKLYYVDARGAMLVDNTVTYKADKNGKLTKV